MYQFSSVSDVLGGISCLYHSVNDNAFFIAIETNDYDIRTKNGSIGIHELFARVLHLISSETTIEEIPGTFATIIDSILKESNRNLKSVESTEANFVAVALSGNSVYVCTAGVSRVHLIQKAQLIGITRDHNFADDLLGGVNINSELNVATHSSAFFVTTRTLGNESPENKPPEIVKWTVEENHNYTVLIVSRKYHRFRKPAEYYKCLVESEFVDIIENEDNSEGFLARIVRIP